MSDRRFDNHSAVCAHQLSRLRSLIGALRSSNAFYESRLGAAGIEESIESLDSFTSRMPFTTKAELAADQLQHPPYGTNLTHPVEQYVRLHQTSSTTGNPIRWLDTAEDWSSMVDDWVEVFEVAGVTPRDRLFAAFSFGPFIGFWMAFEAAVRMGCLSIPGGSMNSLTRLRVILSNDVTVLCCTPTYATRLGETALQEGIDLSQSKVRTIIVAGEPGGSLPATRHRIESLWPGASVFDHHGMTEIGPATYECPQREGVLHLIESSLLCEFVDPATGEPLDADAGQDGELVVTTLNRTGSPLLRYRTGDLVRPGPVARCACGRVERTLPGGILGRIDDMVFVRGVNLYPSTIDEIIRRHDGIAEYRVEVSEVRGMMELELLVEPDAQRANGGDLKAAIGESIRAALNLRVPVRVVPPDTLPRFEFKSARWVKTPKAEGAS